LSWIQQSSGFASDRCCKAYCLEITFECASVVWHADWAWTYEHYVRDVPGSFEFWMENMMDQSHVAYSHSGVAGNRSAFWWELLTAASPSLQLLTAASPQ